jgi:hypothetical protein
MTKLPKLLEEQATLEKWAKQEVKRRKRSVL